MIATLADETPVNLRAAIAAVLVTTEEDAIARTELRSRFPYGAVVHVSNGREKGVQPRDAVTMRIKMHLKRFDRAGWIRRDGDHIHIIDRDQLLRVAVGLLSPTGPEGIR